MFEAHVGGVDDGGFYQQVVFVEGGEGVGGAVGFGFEALDVVAGFVLVVSAHGGDTGFEDVVLGVVAFGGCDAICDADGVAVGDVAVLVACPAEEFGFGNEVVLSSPAVRHREGRGYVAVRRFAVLELEGVALFVLP